MTRDESRELFRQTVVPVILGNGMRSYALSLRLFLRYGIRSVICGRRRSFADLLDPFSDFLRFYSRDDRLMLEQLFDLHDGGRELVMPLVPMSEEYGSFVREYSESLESRYILCRGRDIDRLGDLLSRG